MHQLAVSAAMVLEVEQIKHMMERPLNISAPLKNGLISDPKRRSSSRIGHIAL
jgi:hypothetical protein